MKDTSLDLQELSDKDFVCILLDIILYQNDELVNNAFKLLVLFFTQTQSLLELMSEVQLLEKSTDVAIMKRVQQELP